MHPFIETIRTRRSRAGFSILEVVVALFLIGLLVMAVYSAITSGMATTRMARENLRATHILLEKTEAIRLYNWDQLKPGFMPDKFIVNYDVNSSSTTKGILYYGNITIADAATGTSYSPDMKKVTVRVDWKTGNINRSREMSTYVCRSGLQNYVF